MPAEVIIVQHDGKWTTTKLESRGTLYEDSSYKWHMVMEEGEEVDRYLFPSDMWVVLRGMDVGLDFEHIVPQVPKGQRKVYLLAATN